MNLPQQPVVSGLELWEWRNLALSQAISANIPANEVDWLLQEISNLDSLALRLESFKNCPTIPLKLPFLELSQRWQQRITKKIPIQYLAGATPWRDFSLKVSPAVLIPRPETEDIIDLAIAALNSSPFPYPLIPQSGLSHPQHWADLGTGSGAIAIGLAKALPTAIIHAVDISAEALTIAHENTQQLGFDDRIHCYQGSWWEPLADFKGKITGMVSNPPYIPSAFIPNLQPEVTLHEPHLALDGGIDGLDCLRHLVYTAPEYLCPGGLWLVEMMAGQAPAVLDLLHTHGSYSHISIHADFADIHRFALAYVH